MGERSEAYDRRRRWPHPLARSVCRDCLGDPTLSATHKHSQKPRSAWYHPLRRVTPLAPSNKSRPHTASATPLRAVSSRMKIPLTRWRWHSARSEDGRAALQRLGAWAAGTPDQNVREGPQGEAEAGGSFRASQI